jgi:hypothetical protein
MFGAEYMAKFSPKSDKTKAVSMAVGVSAIAAIGTMFVPTGLLESITGATGLSEIFPSTAAPLGDTARAMIAFGTGASVLAIALGFFLKNTPSEKTQTEKSAVNNLYTESNTGDVTMDMSSRLAGFKEKFGSIQMPKMPWARKNEEDVFDLADLPRIRSQDSHPDAPARAPLSASRDLTPAASEELVAVTPVEAHHEVEPLQPVYQPAPREGSQPLSMPAAMQAEPQNPAPVPTASPMDRIDAAPAEMPPVKIELPNATFVPVADTAEKYGNMSADELPSLAEMVAQLEQSVKLRKQHLAELELIAQQLTQQSAPQDTGVPAVTEIWETPVMDTAQEPEEIIVAPTYQRPPLEAVPSTKPADEEAMDSALDAALATLQRMNAQSR